ncbi:MAG: hypothetical protein LBR15_07915 [Methanobrevibacter sp.]|jgi:hypothetical protein|nr:hypothetical protein [Candidatus Methanovirga australis]
MEEYSKNNSEIDLKKAKSANFPMKNENKDKISYQYIFKQVYRNSHINITLL